MLDYTGFDEKVITIKSGERDVVGKPMTIAGNNYALVSPPGSTFIGFGIASRDGHVTVQVGGYIKVKTSGEGISHGRLCVVADGNGGIQQAASGNIVHVVNYDSETGIAGIIF